MGKARVSVVIAAATVEDVADIVALEREAAEAPHWSETTYTAIVAASGAGPLQRVLFVAKTEGKLVGFAVGQVLGDEAELESIAVRASARRIGAGRALCVAVVAWAWAQGAVTVELEVRASSAGAITLYRGLGFSVTGSRSAYYAAPVEDAVLMRLVREV